MIGTLIGIVGFFTLIILSYKIGKSNSTKVNFTAREIKDIVDLYAKEKDKFDVFLQNWDYKKCQMLYEKSQYGSSNLKSIKITK